MDKLERIDQLKNFLPALEEELEITQANIEDQVKHMNKIAKDIKYYKDQIERLIKEINN